MLDLAIDGASPCVWVGAGVFCAWWLYTMRVHRYPTHDPRDSAVVITGCSSGIGRHAAATLAARGYTVFAGVRRVEDGTSLVEEVRGASGRVVPTIIDVANPDSIAQSAEFVRQRLQPRARTGGGGGGRCDDDGFPAAPLRLAAIVSNAGLSTVNVPVEMMDLAATKTMFDVNVWGGIAFVQAFLPLLRESAGRVVVISSLMRACTFTNTSAYGASKAALNSFMCSLRVELDPWCIPVLIIEPGAIRTRLSMKLVQGIGTVLSSPHPRGEDLHALYGTQLQGTMGMMQVFDRFVGGDPAMTSRAIADAISNPRPKLRYRVGLDAWLIIPWASLAPDWLLLLVTPWVTTTKKVRFPQKQ